MIACAWLAFINIFHSSIFISFPFTLRPPTLVTLPHSALATSSPSCIHFSNVQVLDGHCPNDYRCDTAGWGAAQHDSDTVSPFRSPFSYRYPLHMSHTCFHLPCSSRLLVCFRFLIPPGDRRTLFCCSLACADEWEAERVEVRCVKNIARDV